MTTKTNLIRGCRPAYTRVPLAALILLAARMAVADQPSSVIPHTEHTIEHDGLHRYYIVAEPASYRPGAPVVVVLHGGTQSMRTILEETAATHRWLQIAKDNGFLVLAPNGFNAMTGDAGGDRQTWNDLRPSVGNPISEEDDAGFIAATITCEATRRGFDRRAVFVTGASNGGMMAFRMLIEYPDHFAAGAAFIANLPEAVVPKPKSIRPVMILNGDADPLMPWEGGVVGFGGAPVRSGPETVAYWRRVNGIFEPPTTRLLPDIDPADGARILEFTYRVQPQTPPPVVLYRMVGGGHAIPVLPTDPQVALPAVLGRRCRDARGIDLAWAFFSAHRPSGPPAIGVGLEEFQQLGACLRGPGGAVNTACRCYDSDDDDDTDLVDAAGFQRRFNP